MNVSAEGGRYGSRQLAGNLGGGNDTVDFNLSAADFETDGFNARTTDTVLRDDDGYDNTTVHGRVGWNVTRQSAASAWWRAQRRRRTTASTTASPWTPSRPPTAAATNLNSRPGAWRRITRPDVSVTSWPTAAATPIVTLIPTDSSASGAQGELERSGYLGSFNGSDALRLVYGVDLETRVAWTTATTERPRPDGYYLEYQGGFSDRLFVTAGTRYDDNDDFGTTPPTASVPPTCSRWRAVS